jgi:hypothetical protein
MPTPLAPTHDPGSLPPAAVAHPMQPGTEKLARALDGKALEGRGAVKRVRRIKASAEARSHSSDGRGRRVDRTA